MVLFRLVDHEISYLASGASAFAYFQVEGVLSVGEIAIEHVDPGQVEVVALFGVCVDGLFLAVVYSIGQYACVRPRSAAYTDGVAGE